MILYYMKNVLLLENIDQVATDYFLKHGYAVKTHPHALDESGLMQELEDITLLGIRSKTKITESVIKKSRKLKAVGAFCIGTDQIDLTSAKKHELRVFNAPFSNTRSVAELALGEMIMLARGVTEKNNTMHEGIWKKSAVNSFELRGKKLGIIGYGNIGMQLSVLAEALGMRVIFYDLIDRLSFGNAHKCTSMKALLKEADVISIHVDGRKANTNLIGQKEFSDMKDGVIFLNLSRGKIVDLDALTDALLAKKVLGAAIDVFPQEPGKNGEGFSSRLQHIQNVILTPHIAGSTKEAQADIARFVSRKLVEYHIAIKDNI